MVNKYSDTLLYDILMHNVCTLLHPQSSVHLKNICICLAEGVFALRKHAFSDILKISRF